MKIPRDISGKDLVKILKKYDYKVTKQTGSHIRLTLILSKEHHITIPNHNPIKTGTLNSILNEISKHLNIDKENIIKELI